MLFNHATRRYGERIPRLLKGLNPICKNFRAHGLPLRMVLIGESQSDRGQPMAVYACPNCNCREGYVEDRYTGRPLRLWHRTPRFGH